ncbi:MAG TPA: recombinase family protein [Rickettsia endosymbiont of Omalisus fontisbellaquei]|nr:recombinase family protein [Rickettsia endosymbiont of Omalisus fontisbellaquei]
MKQKKIASKAILILKESPKEQKKDYLNNAQKYRLQEYCKSKGLEVLKIFEFIKSSTKSDLKKFKEAIEFAEQQEEITAIVIDKFYKLECSYEEMLLLDDLINKEKIELHFHIESCIIRKYSIAQDRLLWSLFIMVGQHFFDSIRRSIKCAIEQKRKINSN